jgi:hypothetical protein
MIKGNWYKETETRDVIFFRFLNKSQTGNLVFDKSVGGFKSPKKFIWGYPGMSAYLIPATPEEIIEFNLN